MTWDVLACCHFVDEGWGILCEMWSIATNSISPSVSVPGLIEWERGNSVHDRVCKRKICVNTWLKQWKCHEFSGFPGLLGEKGGIAWSSSSHKQEQGLSISHLAQVARPEKEGYLLAFPHLKIWLHKQFLTLFYLHWNTPLTKLGKKKSMFFSSSKMSRNTTLVTDPFLVGDLVSLTWYLWHILSMHHVNSSAQECLELGLRYLFLHVLTLGNAGR